MEFDEYAKKWDTEARIIRAKAVAKEIEEAVPINKDYSAMEFGCGTGLVSFNFYNKFKKVTLIDESQGMLDVVDDKIKKYSIKNMISKRLDIFKDPVEENFDVIYNSLVLHHIKDTEGIAKIFYDLLNEDGYLCIVDLDEEDGSFHRKYPDFDGYNGFNQERLRKVFEKAGFKKVESKTFYYGSKIIDGDTINYTLFLLKAVK